LCSLDKTDEIPVDTHVRQIAQRDYGMKELVKVSSLTDRVYAAIGTLFRDKFGDFAGYAHTVLFVADIPEFAQAMPEELRRKRIPKTK
jgi:N-glycosylase/DNA lyase